MLTFLEAGLIAGLMFYLASQFTPEHRNHLDHHEALAEKSNDFDLYTDALDSRFEHDQEDTESLLYPSFGTNKFFGKGNPSSVSSLIDPHVPYNQRHPKNVNNMKKRQRMGSVEQYISNGSRKQERLQLNPTRDQGAYSTFPYRENLK